MTGKHVNTQLPKILGAARLYEMTGQQRDATIASFFWDSVVDNRTFAPGGMDLRERFCAAGEEANRLSWNNCETCAVYNMLKLTRHLFGWQPDARYMDYYERALYNTILGSQDPDSGGFTYFNSLKPGHFKIYSVAVRCDVVLRGLGHGEPLEVRRHDLLPRRRYVVGESLHSLGTQVAGEGRDHPAGNSVSDKDTTTIAVATKQEQKLAVKIRVPYWVTQDAASHRQRRETNGRSEAAELPDALPHVEGRRHDQSAVPHGAASAACPGRQGKCRRHVWSACLGG